MIFNFGQSSGCNIADWRDILNEEKIDNSAEVSTRLHGRLLKPLSTILVDEGDEEGIQSEHIAH